MALPFVTGCGLFLRQHSRQQRPPTRPTGVLPGQRPSTCTVAAGLAGTGVGLTPSAIAATPVLTPSLTSSQQRTVSFISGATSGLVTTVALQPLDLVKTRVQLTGGVTAWAVVAETTSWTGLWRGLQPSLARTVPGIGLYFCIVDAMRVAARPAAGNLNAMHNFFIGASARTLVGLCTLPLSVVKTRMESGRYAYPTVGRALRTIHGAEGLRGLFAGALPTALRDAPFSGVYLACYAPAKAFVRSRVGDGHWMHNLAVTLSAGLYAGTIASAVTQPQDVIKTRMQVNSTQRATFWSTLLRIRREEGVAGLFRGLRLRIFRRTLVAAVSWSMYEQLSPALAASLAAARA